MTALTQQLMWDIPGLGVWVMASGYLLALIALALFAIECHLGVRKTRRIDQLERQVAERDERDDTIDDLQAELDYLHRQNLALFGRCAPASRGARS